MAYVFKPAPQMVKVLGSSRHHGNLYEYILKDDNFVYQYRNGKQIGYICNHDAWLNTFRKLVERELK